MSTFKVLLAVATASWLMRSIAADAGGISGSFVGVVTSSQTGFGGTGNVNGQTVTGTFGTHFDTCPPVPQPGYTCFVPQMLVTFDIAGQIYSFGQYGTIKAIFVADPATGGQLLTLLPDEGDPHGRAALTLAGPANAFVTGGDYVDLHPGPVFAAGSNASLTIRETIAAGIQLTSVQVDGVPEPASWTLMIAGFALVGAIRRRNLAGAAA